MDVINVFVSKYFQGAFFVFLHVVIFVIFSNRQYRGKMLESLVCKVCEGLQEKENNSFENNLRNIIRSRFFEEYSTWKSWHKSRDSWTFLPQ